MSFTERRVIDIEQAKAQLRGETTADSDVGDPNPEDHPAPKAKRGSKAKGEKKPKRVKKPEDVDGHVIDGDASETPKRGRGRPPKQRMPAEQAIEAMRMIQQAYRAMEDSAKARRAVQEEMKAKIEAAEARFRQAIEVGIPADDLEAAAKKLDVVLTGWQHLEESKSEKVEECKVALEDFERLKKAFVDAIVETNQMKFTF